VLKRYQNDVDSAQHLKNIETLPKQILACEADWESLLGQLKVSCEFHPDKSNNVYAKHVVFKFAD